MCANCLYYTYRHYTVNFLIQAYFLPSCRCFLSRAHVITVMGGGGGGGGEMCNCIFVGVTGKKNLITAFLKICSFLAKGL